MSNPVDPPPAPPEAPSGPGASSALGSKRSLSPAQISLAGLIGAVGLGMLTYKLLTAEHLEQTAALFIGLPTLISVALALTPRWGRSSLGVIMKGLTIMLLMSALFLGEGFICVLMMAPIFYGTGVVVWLLTVLVGQLVKRLRGQPPGKAFALAPLLVMLPLSVEGLHERLSFDREETVRAEALVAATPEQVAAALAAPLRFERPLPYYLRLGFPRPAEGAPLPLALGARRSIHFAGGEGKPGDAVWEVAAIEPGRIRLRLISDSSHLAHWLAFEEVECAWRAEGDRTRVEVTVKYRRLLDPAWYFGPWERYGVGLAAEYFAESQAAPR